MRTIWAVMLAVLLGVTFVEAQPGPNKDWEYGHGGTHRTETLLWHKGDSLAVNNTDSYIDSTILVEDQSDTTKGVYTAGASGMAASWLFNARNDTANVTITAQVSADTSLGTDAWLDISPTFVTGFSADIADNDTLVARVYKSALGDTTNMSAGMPFFEAFPYTRFIATLATNSGDTVDVKKGRMHLIYPAAGGKTQSR